MTSTLQPQRPPQSPGDPRAPRSGPSRSGPSRSGGAAERLPGLRRHHVGAVIGLLVGAGVMLSVATLNQVNGTQIPVLSNLAAAPAESSDNPQMIAPRPPPPATPGSCLNWRRPDAADAESVDCGKAHLFEQAGSIALTDLPTGDALPGNDVFRKLVNERCTPMVIAYLGGKYDPNGTFRAGALKPSAKRWDEGDRALRCGLQRFSRSGALYPISGKVSQQDQADVRAAGTCLGIDGRFIGDPVDCSLPHAVESVGFIDLGGKFKGKYPSVADQDAFLQPACTKLASDYSGGGKNISDKKLSVLWDNLTPESWSGGTREVACNLAAQLPDKSGFAPVTGSVKGPVQVGDRPAPPARATVPPGAPAPQGASEPGPPLEEEPSETVADNPPAAPPQQLNNRPPLERGPDPDRTKDPAPVKLPEDKLPQDPLPRDLPKDRLPSLPGQDGDRRAPSVPNPLGR